jgi:hypothetical protein
MSNNNILGLPPINSGFSFGINPVGSNPESQTLPKGEIKENNQDSIRRRVAVDIIATNNEHAIQRVTKMDQNAFVAFYSSTQFIVEMNMESQGTPYQKYCDAFSDRLIKVSAHHTFGLLDTGAMRIAYEVNRPPLLDDKPKGLLGTLFG